MTTKIRGSGNEVDLFFRRHADDFGADMASSSVGGDSNVAFGLETEREPHEFVMVYRVALDGLEGGSFAPSNKQFKIRRIDLDRTLGKRVRIGRPDAGDPIFALQPVKVAGVVAEVASSNHTKSRKRRKRRRRSRE